MMSPVESGVEEWVLNMVLWLCWAWRRWARW